MRVIALKYSFAQFRKFGFIEQNTPTISDAAAGAFSVAIWRIFSIFAGR